MCVQVPMEAERKHGIPLKLELQLVMRHPTWVLETELQSSRRAANILYC